MASALLNICVDPRLNHDALRDQLRRRLTQDVPARNVFVVADIAGNLGSAARNTIGLLRKRGEDIVVAGVLHHDDCLAAAEGQQQPLAATAKALEAELRQAGFKCPLLTGTIATASSSITWTDSPPRSLEVLRFRMPRMYG